MKKLVKWLTLGLALASLSGCGYNRFQSLDEAVKANQARVLNVYQKRADLIPNIVTTVKGEANFEQETLTKVIEARAKATQVTPPDPEKATPEQMKAFVEAQKAVGSGLARLLAVSENYPNLKANAAFSDLRRQLSEVETQATAARNIYIKSVRDYNVLTRSFPTNLTAMVFSYETKPQIQFEDEAAIKKTPQVKF
jgi:LemA protein